MRIAYVCADSGVPIHGCKGASVHVQEVIRSLRRRGAEVELFAANIGGATEAGFDNVPIHALPPIAAGERAFRERAAIAANEGLRTTLEQVGPFDLVYERYSLWSFAAMEYARAAGTPGLLEVNAPLIDEQAQHRGLVDHPSAARIAARTFRAAAALLAVSEGVATYLENHLEARDRVHVVPNGVDPRRFTSRITRGFRGVTDEFTVGFVGTLKPWHGLGALVDAFAILRNRDASMRLLIVGDGPQRECLTRQLEGHALNEVAHFTGAVPPAEIPEWLAYMDVAVAPYPNMEGFYFSPLKVFEYMAAGLPVVASRIGQLASLIQDGVNGVLCRPDDAAALAAAIARLRADARLRSRLGAAGRATVLQHHTWDSVTQRILELAGFDPIPAVRSTQVLA